MSKSQLVALLVMTIANVCGVVTADNESPPFKITAKRENDKVEVKVENDQTIFSVHSPLGISQAVIERVNEKWPDVILLRLHLFC